MNERRPGCLVIDDDAAFRDVLAGALRRRGYDVIVAADAATALVGAQRKRPRYAVLDLRLEHDSGLQLIAPLLECLPELRIVVLTGYASIATAVQAIKLGAVHYLTKPAETDEIIEAFAREPDPDTALANEPTPLQRLEWEHIQKALIASDGNISDAARRLGLHRRTLQRKLQKRPPGR
ncbi:MAG: response regulator [Gammaproteobacteria bacterium]